MYFYFYLFFFSSDQPLFCEFSHSVNYDSDLNSPPIVNQQNKTNDLCLLFKMLLATDSTNQNFSLKLHIDKHNPEV